MTESPILGWTTETRFGCSNPIRAGDLLVTRTKLASANEIGRFFPAGTLCLVLGPAEDRINREDYSCISVMIDGVIEDMHPGSLEFPNETR